MGLAAMAFVALVALVILVFFFYGIVLGMARLARFTGQAYRWTKKASAPARAEQPAGEGPSCWEEKNCPMLVRQACPAYVNPSDPCWLANLRKAGQIKAACMGCSRFSMTDYVDDEAAGTNKGERSAG